MTPDMIAELDKLRDIRLPDPVGWWPLAIGWWVVLALGVLAMGGLIYAYWQYRRSLRRLALIELADLKRRLAAGAPAHGIAIDLAVLLRRVGLHTTRRSAVPGLTSEAWARELTRGEAGLPEEVAEFLAQAPYAPETADRTPADAALLNTALSDSARWIRRNSR
ncbi:DUF4381 domain-containing protein [Pseudoruegeria sp. SK021]|uniref:DUF4381 domain-containing protein n=1 Tax=Pseudoruegeria sp. SK021 TaxID=1933035 RepID=UPI000A21FC10|nr:DUF4381 domain-containing protein [Pseudoruegeria sp. SK021]OSP55973.1 hypothetical protein BV911_04815 [Pseudoruegeria sp. SK021]